MSISRRSLELGNPHRILHKDLGFKAFISQKQELTPTDHKQRLVFVDWVLEMHQTDLEFHRKMVLRDEADYHFKKHNFRIWGS